jgi:Tol biopolymer transport system component
MNRDFFGVRRLTALLGMGIALGIASVAFPASSAIAGIGDELGLSPFHDWHQIESEHFRVVFPKELSARAERVAQLYEEAHRDLKTDLRWEPWWRVNVLLLDNTDAANGMTTPISRFGMLLYLTSPDTFSSIDLYDDWLKLLIYHEYTHFLNMDATRSFYTPLRYLLGDVILPNSALPPWMLEGYAVYQETKHTSAGRGRSPYWDGILRSAVETDTLGKSDFVTLDQINGTRPRFPFGEVTYLFGYHLMNQAERTRRYTLSDLTEASSGRVPFFINGNLENITGKDWYTLWDEWVAETYVRMKGQLATLASEPLSKIERLDKTRGDSLGIAFSPDGNWVAYSTENEDEWQTLKVRAWSPAAGEMEPRSVDDKFSGAGIAFLPDSNRLVYSSLHRWQNYNFYSDLRVYEVSTGRKYWITDGQRARDPDVSKDGNWIVFTQTHDSGTDLMLGKLVTEDGKLRIDARKKIVDAATYERISVPKFSPDRKGVVFGWRRAGKKQDDLYYFDFKKNAATPLVANGARNRFPAYDAKGTLYFVSDKTGVDNLYRYSASGAPALVTNVTGGLWLPAFRGTELYASVLSKDGFSLAHVSTHATGISPTKVTVKIGETAPQPDAGNAAAAPVPAKYAIEKYSALPTLLPRQWAPLWISDLNTTYLGAQVFGYDNVFRHQYFAYGAHDSTAKTWDYSVQYENRSFGPTLQLYAQKLTSDTIAAKNSLTGNTKYSRETEGGLNLSFPFQGTVSRLTPSIGARIERDAYYDYPAGATEPRKLAQTRVVPEQDATIEFQNVRGTPLGVAPERGGISLLGVRRYDLGEDVFKGIAKHTQFLHLGNHFVLSPSVKATRVNHVDRSFIESTAIARGKRERVLNPLYSDNFDEFGIRGYPLLALSTREAVTIAADLRFPIAQIFRGWGTNPLFLNQLWMQLFVEDTYLRHASPRFQHFASAGAGLRLNTELLLALPLTLNLDYHYGFNKNAGSQEDLFFSLTLSSILPF